MFEASEWWNPISWLSPPNTGGGGGASSPGVTPDPTFGDPGTKPDGSITPGPGFNWTDLIVPGIEAGIDIWSAKKIAEGQKDANEKNLQSARELIAWQENLSNTAHQREVRDLEKAGLNPVLSANHGASTPSGVMATVSNAAPDYRGIFGKTVSSALELRQKRKDVESIDQSIRESRSRENINKETERKTAAEADIADTAAKFTKLVGQGIAPTAKAVKGVFDWSTDVLKGMGEKYIEFNEKNGPYIENKSDNKAKSEKTGKWRDLGVKNLGGGKK